MNMVLRRTVELGLFAAAISFSCAAWPQAPLSSSTEQELPNQAPLPHDVVKLILRNEPQDAALLSECIAERGLKRTAAVKFFTAAALYLNSDNQPDYFVRPALDPYCHAFYGAHLFRYWFVTANQERGKIIYKITLKGGGDEVHVLRSRTNGYLDLELVGHTTSESYTTLVHFNGRRYTQVGCTKRVVSEGHNDSGTPC